jgi:hypothetical protein
MRRLAQPQVMTSAAIAAALTAVASLPRMLLWDKRPFPVWFAEAMFFFCGFVLWAFVFAWHTEHTRRPVFTLRIKPLVLAGATLVGIIAAFGMHWLLDPSVRAHHPEDFPADFQNWMAHTLFIIGFTQLFLLFAPFAWAMRLFRNETAATWVTVAINVLVLALRSNSSPTPLPGLLILVMVGSRIACAYFGVWFYLRGGIFLAWWITFLIEARHLLTLYGY